MSFAALQRAVDGLTRILDIAADPFYGFAGGNEHGQGDKSGEKANHHELSLWKDWSHDTRNRLGWEDDNHVGCRHRGVSRKQKAVSGDTAFLRILKEG